MVAALHEARPPDLARQFLSSGENGLSHSVRWRELGRWGRRCRLPARTESGPLFESDRGQASTACPTRGLTANSTTSGVQKFGLIFCASECERSLTVAALHEASFRAATVRERSAYVCKILGFPHCLMTVPSALRISPQPPFRPLRSVKGALAAAFSSISMPHPGFSLTHR